MEELDDMSYVRFCNRQNLNKALSTLRGIVTGVTIDGELNLKEAKELKHWCLENSPYRTINPFNEIIPMISGFLDDGKLDKEEIQDLQWFLTKALEENQFYDVATGDLQYLQGILHGILSDGIVSHEEVESLSKWLSENEYLAGCYPYDEIYSLVLEVLKDGKVDPNEAELLRAFFLDFANLSMDNQIEISDDLKKKVTTLGVCAVDPQIDFKKKTFCFTGASVRAKRSEFAEIVASLGGFFSKNVIQQLDYLVYGSAGNQCWAYSCYGRKVEQVIEMRKRGKPVAIIHENDFWDYYRDMKA